MSGRAILLLVFLISSSYCFAQYDIDLLMGNGEISSKKTEVVPGMVAESVKGIERAQKEFEKEERERRLRAEMEAYRNRFFNSASGLCAIIKQEDEKASCYAGVDIAKEGDSFRCSIIKNIDARNGCYASRDLVKTGDTNLCSIIKNKDARNGCFASRELVKTGDTNFCSIIKNKDARNGCFASRELVKTGHTNLCSTIKNKDARNGCFADIKLTEAIENMIREQESKLYSVNREQDRLTDEIAKDELSERRMENMEAALESGDPESALKRLVQSDPGVLTDDRLLDVVEQLRTVGLL